MKLIIVGLALLGLSVARASNSDEAEHQPAPEPYSFSYSAESTGGFSSRQETGDGTGRVEGFYIIMGDDQRERRVDYVADKDGYRASISTNEIGTRSQSSADAQYQARLPSQGQLDQAKTTLEEYKFMEEQHEFERTRPLNRNNQQTFQLNRQQQQPEQTNQFTETGQRWSMSGGGQTGFTASDWQQQQQQQQRQQQQQQQRWASSQNPAENVNPQRATQFEQAPNNQTTTTTLTEAQDDDYWRSAKLLADGAQQTSTPNQQQRPRGTSSSSALTVANAEVETGPVFSSNIRAQAPAQQTNLPAWKTPTTQVGGTQTSARLVSAGSTDFGRQQFNQQFMQQANQLAAEDYPRQQQQQQDVNTIRQLGQTTGQIVVGQQTLRPQPNLNQWQNQPLAANNNVARGQQETYGQISQQQNNIIDEISGEKIELGQQVGAGQQVSENFGTTTSGPQVVEPAQPNQFVARPAQPQPEPAKQQQQQLLQQDFQQQAQAYEEPTTTRQPMAPSGFLAIDLGRQEAELRPERPNTNLPTTASSLQQVEGEQVVDVQNQDNQRQEVQQFQQQQPDSIQQIIREGAIKKQQATFTKPTTQQPTTTFRAKLMPETTTTFQPITKTTPSATTRTPIETTFATTAAKATSVIQGGFSSSLLEQPTRRPTLSRQPQQTQFVGLGVKGGAKQRTEQRLLTTSTAPAEQPQVVSEIPRIPTGPIKLDESTNVREPNYQQTLEQVVSNRPTTQRVPSSSPSNMREQQQQQLEILSREKVTPTSTTAQPIRFETTAKEIPAPQSQSKQWTGGVKGASKVSNRRQFWQPSGSAVSSNKQQNSSLGIQKSASTRGGAQNFQASVDYVGQQFGSRVQNRAN